MYAIMHLYIYTLMTGTPQHQRKPPQGATPVSRIGFFACDEDGKMELASKLPDGTGAEVEEIKRQKEETHTSLENPRKTGHTHTPARPKIFWRRPPPDDRRLLPCGRGWICCGWDRLLLLLFMVSY